jgi:hypothetical protein
MRGTSIVVRRSLRTRVISASALAFLGLAAVVCLVLPRAYEAQAKADFAARTERAARALAAQVPLVPGGEPEALRSLGPGFLADPLFEGAAVFDAEGRVLAKWPEQVTFTDRLASGEGVLQGPASCVAFQRVGAGVAERVVAVRLTGATLVRDAENVRWLFASIFLFTSVVFFVLTKYLTRTILHPIEEIGRAAMSLADGEPVVQVPQTGDREIDELGEFIAKLGESRRQSRVMVSPLDLLAAQGWGRNPVKHPSAHGPANPEPARPPAEEPGSAT